MCKLGGPMAIASDFLGAARTNCTRCRRRIFYTHRANQPMPQFCSLRCMRGEAREKLACRKRPPKSQEVRLLEGLGHRRPSPEPAEHPAWKQRTGVVLEALANGPMTTVELMRHVAKKMKVTHDFARNVIAATEPEVVESGGVWQLAPKARPSRPPPGDVAIGSTLRATLQARAYAALPGIE